jgi:hypothetical protein
MNFIIDYLTTAWVITLNLSIGLVILALSYSTFKKIMIAVTDKCVTDGIVTGAIFDNLDTDLNFKKNTLVTYSYSVNGVICPSSISEKMGEDVSLKLPQGAIIKIYYVPGKPQVHFRDHPIKQTDAYMYLLVNILIAIVIINPFSFFIFWLMSNAH